MYVLTDMGKNAASYFEKLRCKPLDVKEVMTADLENVSQVFFNEAPLRCLDFTSAYMGDRFQWILLSEQAPHSNLDMLSSLHRKGVKIPEGLVCAAYTGKGFLGRHDRSWKCEPGNLHVVFHLKPMIEPAVAGPSFSIVAAVACVSALRKLYGNRQPPLIKWVNDLFVGSKKIAGVLTRQTYQDPCITDVFLGLGVNVQVEPRLTPDPFVPDTGCLRKVYNDPALSPGHLLFAIMIELERWYDQLLAQGNKPLLDFYRKHAGFMNRNVRIYEDGYGFDNKEISQRKIAAQGRVASILNDLSLKFEGSKTIVSNGRLAFEEDCP